MVDGFQSSAAYDLFQFTDEIHLIAVRRDNHRLLTELFIPLVGLWLDPVMQRDLLFNARNYCGDNMEVVLD